MVKVLGIGDLIITVLLVASGFKADVPLDMLIFFAVALFFKGLIFLFDIGSIIDIIAAILLILTIFLNIPSIILFIAAVLMGVKALRSLAAH